MKQISVEIIHKCPNRCLHCSSFSCMNQTAKIETSKVIDIIDSAQELKTEVVSISGGEPFLHEGLAEIVQYTKSKGIKAYIYTSGITIDGNGEISNITPQMFETLNALHVDRIIFNLPAIDEQVYNEFMGTHGYQKYALKSISLCKKAGIFTEIHYVPTKINVNQVDRVLAFARSENIDMISFLGLVPHGRAEENREKLYLDGIENQKLKLKLYEKNGKDIRVGIPLQYIGSEYVCCAARAKLCVRYDGKVFGCEAFKYIQMPDDDGNIIVPDSIYEKDLADIYHNSAYLIKEREFVDNQMTCSDCGEKCPVQRMMRCATGL